MVRPEPGMLSSMIITEIPGPPQVFDGQDFDCTKELHRET